MTCAFPLSFLWNLEAEVVRRVLLLRMRPMDQTARLLAVDSVSRLDLLDENLCWNKIFSGCWWESFGWIILVWK